MEESAYGIVLRIRPLTETSLIFHWLTRDQGRIATVAKGARRAKSSFRGKLDLFFEAHLSFVRSWRSELHTLREAVPVATFPSIRTDYERLNQAAYAVRLVELATETETPVPEFFDLLTDWLRHQESGTPSRLSLLTFEWGILDLSGAAPSLDRRRLSPAAGEMLARIQSRSGAVSEEASSRDTERELGRLFSGPLEQQLSRLPEARARLLFE
jgi:DNA repair protein RecO (recombination protein O)